MSECTPCQQEAKKREQQLLIEGCNYTLEQMLEWKRLLFCVRDNEYGEELGINNKKLNKLLGITLSAINIGAKSSICRLRDMLDESLHFITTIINSGKC